MFLDLIQSSRTGNIEDYLFILDIEVIKPSLHTLEIFLMEQSDKLDKLMVYEMHKVFILMAIKGIASVKRGAMSSLGNFYKNPKIKGIFFQSDVNYFTPSNLSSSSLSRLRFLKINLMIFSACSRMEVIIEKQKWMPVCQKLIRQ
jgi:hypothetical protein